MKEITITPHAQSLLWKEKDGNAVRLYLYYLSEGNTEKDGAMRALDLTLEEYASAVARLLTLELIPSGKRLMDETPPTYTREEIAKAVETDNEFKELLHVTEHKMGRIASPNETQILLNIVRWMGMPYSVIFLIVNYCASTMAEKRGRRLTVNMIQKTANKWMDRGIDTPDKADSYLRTLEKQNQYIDSVTEVLHITAMTPSVEGYLREWSDRATPIELVERAADIAAVKFGSLNMPYINGILRGWYEKGLHTLKAVEEQEGVRKPTGGERPASPERMRKPGDKQPSQSEQAALRRAREYYEKKKQKQENP